MRELTKLFLRGPNVLTANLLWPLILVQSLILLCCSFRKGHSPEVQQVLARAARRAVN